MVHVYAAKINRNLSSDRLEYLLGFISEENKERFSKFRFKEDSLRTLYGEVLVRYVSTTQFGFENSEVHLSKNSYGKPYILNSPLHFNISHSGEWVVCALSYKEVGIDIEYIKEIDFDIAKSFFCSCEYESLMERSDAERLNYFYDIWTLKESYIKWLGSGLSTPLDSFCFKIKNKDILLQDKVRTEIPNFRQYDIKGYRLSVCANASCFVEQLNEINVENICIK